MTPHSMTVSVNGKEILFETGKIARQANGSVTVHCGDTVVFASACATKEAGSAGDFMPLRVDYTEKFSSAGKTLGGFIKREGRPTQRETLICRLIDRPLRPMFEEGYFNEVQLMTYVWSHDPDVSLEPLAITAASAALVISDIPLVKPVAGVLVGYIRGEFVVNPSPKAMEESKLELMLAGTEDAILMIEGFAHFLSEDEVMQAIETGHEAIKTICRALSEWQAAIGKTKDRSALKFLPAGLQSRIEEIATAKLDAALAIADKQKREEAVSTIKQEVSNALCPNGDESQFSLADLAIAFKTVQSNIMRQKILNTGKRSDGRAINEIRPIWVEQAPLPRAHGSSLFTRGETQALAVCTLGGDGMGQRFEDLDGEGSQRFYLQYFFPPYSVGEVGRSGPPGRREVGHGKLAEKALQSILPSKEAFPYTIRLESNITESNGSSSMASVCGGCLALMDAGVPIERPVSGIAMGLILDKDRHTILSDILGLEDALGDMDFKVTGDKEGITAFQMDIKVEGITPQIMRAALAQAKEGRVHILEKMLHACPKPRDQMSQYAPRIETLRVKPSKIATIIGPGGKQIRAIIEETGVEINIEDDGTVSITSANLAGIEKAKAIINGLTAEVEIGRVYEGKVVSIVPFGLFVEILPGREGLCHISEYDHKHVKDLNEFVKQGDRLSVKVLDINERGQLKLSRKATLTA